MKQSATNSLLCNSTRNHETLPVFWFKCIDQQQQPQRKKWRGSTKTCLECLNKSPRGRAARNWQLQCQSWQKRTVCSVIHVWAVWLRRNKWSRWAARRLLFRAQVGSNQYRVKQHQRWLYTWIFPDDNTQNQIDYISVAHRWKTSFTNYCTYPGTDWDADYQLLMATLKVRLAKRLSTTFCLWISRNSRKRMQYNLQ